MMRTNVILVAALLGGATTTLAQSGSVQVTSSPSAMTLSKAMEIAEAKSHLLDAAKAGQAAADAKTSQTSGAMGPKLGVEMNEIWFDRGVNDLVGHELPNGTPVPDRINTAGVVLTQPLSSLVTLKNKGNGDRLLAEAAASDAAAAAQQARARAAAAYIRVLKANKFLEIALDSQKVIERQLSDAGKQKAQGKLAQLDYSRLEFAQSEAITQVTDAQASIVTASATLRELLGMGTSSATLEVHDLAAASVPTTAPKARAELVAADSRASATREYQDASRIDYWPSVNAFARYDRDFAAKDIDTPIVQYDKEDIQDKLSYGFAVNWTVWDWNVRRGRVRELAAETTRSEAARDELSANIRVEQIQAKAEVTRATQNQSNAKISSDLSEKIFKATEVKFRNGLATTTDLLMAERDLTRARGNYANSSYDLNWAVIQYKRAMGDDLK